MAKRKQGNRFHRHGIVRPLKIRIAELEVKLEKMKMTQQIRDLIATRKAQN